MNHTECMGLALELAKKGIGKVNPNPMVGAVIVKNGEVIAEGWHKEYGGPHAERTALEAFTALDISPEGATIYVTLEPCCHYGKTPPCTEAIIESGIDTVIIAILDPNPLVAGKGVESLRRAGINVVTGVLEKECRALNEAFIHFIQTNTPFVIMKYAMTMDGKIASYTGESKWITGEAARSKVHYDRSRYAAVMVGVGTVVRDDPLLNSRIEDGRDPVRIICDTSLRTPLDSHVVATAKHIPVLIATSCKDEEKHKPYLSAGCKIVTVPKRDNYINLNELMKRLGEEMIDSVLLEGGGMLNWSALQSGIVNKVQAYIAPKILGGADAKTPVAGMGVKTPDEAFHLKNSVITLLGEDILIESEVISEIVYRHN
ncbi:MAG: bifunctional diaminohydroxyphosphoribosylaminopyrimidine deaminase/5-amino-6-(5-phosphoribosylamino)uracil reductase RibD [Oscillospiraceae bacterium]|nr:bifunctional diaminohydroxyphosphoribosylaminopyrimidine deaminase/5-amino-6-(5-phosphoribosylamino)uracil reductase RibD [Oscillospiraceae bacterium]